MKVQKIITFLAVILASCSSAVAPISTPTPAPPTLIATAEVKSTITPTTPTLTLTQPTFAVITPNAIQIEKWKEYQTALAKKLMSSLPPEEVLCEWDILGQSNQTVYVWAVCQGLFPVGTLGYSSSSTPAVIHIGTDGTPQNVEFPNALMYHNGDIQKMFPMDLKEIFRYYDFGGAKKLFEHIEWRRTHPDEPPLIVLLATPMP